MWVSAKEAATYIGVTYDTIRQQLKRHNAKFNYRYVDGKGRGGRNLEIWVEDGSGEAVTLSRSGEKKPKREKSFALPPVPAPTSNRYLRLEKKEQKEVLEKVELVRSYVNRGYGITWEQWSEGKSNLPTKQHFFRLVKLYKQGIKTQNVVELFCDKRGRPKESFKMTTEMRDMAQRYILRTDIHPNDIGIYNNMKFAFKETLPTVDTVCRYLNHFRDKNKILVAYAKDPERARGKYRAAFGNESEKAKYKNHYWELDGTPADVITSDGKRAAIIGAIDIFSRRVVLSVEDKSTSYALARNLREAILKLGVPENILTDNGRDYTSNHFNNVCQNFGINKREVAPYSGWKKPHIESFFGTMTRELFRQMEGFCGHNVAERSAIQNALGFEGKLEAIKRWKAKKYSEDAFLKLMTNKKEVMEVFVPLTQDELREWLNAWVEAVYEQRKHGGINMSPVEKYNSDITPARMVEDERTLDILLGEWLTYTVGKKGIVIRKDGIEAQYQHTKLIKYSGERVYVALGADAGEIYVYDAEMAFICVATDESLSGRSRETIMLLNKEMNKLERESMRAAKRANELAQKLQDPTIKDIIEANAKKIKLPKHRKMEAKIDIELPKNEATVEMNGDKPFFYSDTEMFMWYLENGREAELNPELVEKRAELYDLTKREVERKTNQKAG